MKVRPSVKHFTQEMEGALRHHDITKKGQREWRAIPVPVLFKRLCSEVGELGEALSSSRHHIRKFTLAEVCREAADVANYAMMIADSIDREAFDIPEDRP